MDTVYQYPAMLTIRLVEEEIAKRYSDQQMRCPTHLSIGQEAVAVGVSANLTREDKVYSSHRAHAHYLAKGGSLPALIAELYGKATGCTGGRGGSMHLSDLSAGFVASTAIVANSIPLAVGNALHQQVQKKNEVSVAYFGDGAVEEGAFYEAANFAVVRKLPILFVCENNRYSVYSNLSPRQPQNRNIHELAEAIGVTSVEVDGNDVEQVMAASGLLLKKVRAGEGPAFIECHTYRHREHCGPNFDDQLNYRDEREVDYWLNRDPIKQLERQYISHFSEAKHQALVDAIKNEINTAFKSAIAAPFPHEKDNHRFVYG